MLIRSGAEDPVTEAMLPEHLAALYNRFAPTAVGLFNETGSVTAQIFMLTLDENDPSEIVRATSMHPSEVEMFFRSKESIGALREMIDEVLDPSSAVRQSMAEAGTPPVHMVVQICQGNTNTPLADSAAEDARVPEETNMAPDHALPQGADFVIVALHTRMGTFFGANPVLGASESSGRRCELVPIDFDHPMLSADLSIRIRHPNRRLH
jgi:hypothetical protein